MGSMASKTVDATDHREMSPVYDRDMPQHLTTIEHGRNCTDITNIRLTYNEETADGSTGQKSQDSPSQLLCRNLTKKQDMMTHHQMFQMVDQHARNTPGEMSTNSERLLTYLMSSCTTPLHIIRIFYMWITSNIRCDDNTHDNLTLLEFKPATVLANKQATPVGMNLLFYYFCCQVRIPCSLIHGVLKTDNQSTSSLRLLKNKPNHVWALVIVQDQWRFVDCACGSRICDYPKGTTTTREFFFMPDPELHINSHYPMGMTNEINIPGFPDTLEAPECLQMLEKPYKFGQFCRQAMISLTGLSISLQLLTHLSSIVRVDKGEQLSFRSPELEDISAVLTDKTSGKEFPHSVLCMRTSSSEYRIVVKPRFIGDYRLDVLGKIRGSQGKVLHRLVDYEILTQEVEEKFSPFPDHFGVWGANPKALQVGFSRRIFKFDVLSCRTGDLYIKLPLTNCIRVKAVLTPAVKNAVEIPTQHKIDPSTPLSTLTLYNGGVVHIKARFSSTGFFSLALLAQNSKSAGSLTSLTASPTCIKVADFLVCCRRRSAYSSPLPKSFPMSQQCHCLLLEPLHRDLVVFHTYNFRVTSPYMHILKIEGENMIREKRISNEISKTPQSHENNNDNGDDVFPDTISEDGVDNVWSLRYTPKTVGSSIYVYGSGNKLKSNNSSSNALSALFVFRVVEDVGFGRKDNELII